MKNHTFSIHSGDAGTVGFFVSERSYGSYFTILTPEEARKVAQVLLDEAKRAEHAIIMRTLLED